MFLKLRDLKSCIVHSPHTKTSKTVFLLNVSRETSSFAVVNRSIIKYYASQTVIRRTRLSCQNSKPSKKAMFHVKHCYMFKNKGKNRGLHPLFGFETQKRFRKTKSASFVATLRVFSHKTSTFIFSSYLLYIYILTKTSKKWYNNVANI